jgi:hypothetical protein
MIGVRLNIPDISGLPLNAIQAAHFSMPPGVTGIRWCNFLGYDVQLSAFNRVRGQPNGSVVGAPVVSPNYLSLKGGSVGGGGKQIKTPFVDTSALTYIAIVRSSDTAAANASTFNALGNHSAAVSGAELFLRTGATGWQFRLAVMISDVPTFTSGVAITTAPADWRMIIASGDAASHSIYDMTGAVSNTLAVAANTGRVIATETINIGGSPTGARGGEGDVGLAMVLDHVATSEERAAIYAFYKPIFGGLGIAI